MINELINNISYFTKNYESQVLDGSPESLRQTYNRSRENTQRIADQVFNTSSSAKTPSQSSSPFATKEIALLDFFVQTGEDLDLLLKINETTKKIDSALISSLKDKLFSFFDEIITEEGQANPDVINRLKQSESLYIDFLTHFSQHRLTTFSIDFDEFVTESSETNKEILSLLLRMFKNTESSSTLNKVAKLIAKHIKRLAGDDEECRFQAALALAQEPEARIYLERYLNQFSITDQKRLYTVVDQIVQTDSGAAGLTVSFDLSLLTNENDRKKIALAVAQKPLGAEMLPQNFQNFLVTEEKACKEIASAIARHESGAKNLAEYIETFALSNEEDRAEIARAIVQHNLGAARLASRFDRFALSQKVHKELALAIAQSPSGAANLTKQIQLFSVPSEEDLKEIALAIARHDIGALNLSRNFRLWPFSDNKTRREIAIAIAQRSSGAIVLAENIHKFSLSDEQDLREIALVILQTPGGAKALIDHEEDFPLRGEPFELEAILKAFRSPSSLISLETYLTESDIAKKIPLLSLIPDLPLLIDFEEMSESEKRELMAFPLKVYGLTPQTIKEKLSSFAEDDPQLAPIRNYATLDRANRSDWEQYLKACQRLKKAKNNAKGKQMKKLADDLISSGKFWTPFYDCLDAITNEDDSERQYELTHWMIYSTLCLLLSDPEKERDVPFDSQVLKLILNVRDMDLRVSLSDVMASQTNEEPLETTPQHTVLPKLLLRDLKKKDDRISSETFSKSLRKKKSFLRDGEKQNVLLKALSELKASKDIHVEQINDTLEYWSKLNDRELLTEIKAFSAIISLKMETSIKIDPKKSDHLQMTSCLSKAVQELLPGLNITNEKRFSDTFFGQREPGALAIYAARLEALPDQQSKEVKASLKQFIEDVDSGSFHASRYLGSKHLDLMAKNHAALFEEWKKGKEGPLEAYLPKETDQDIIQNIVSGLITKIVTDGHLPIEKLPKVAKACGVEVASFDAFDELDTLLSDVIQNPERLDLTYLTRLLSVCEALPNEEVNEFIHDIRTFKNSLNPKADATVNWTLVDSDQPLDLFLCGTEVGGSCQRVNGTPQFNKALMGYVMDGKHRILAVKNEKGKIVERLILRLLYDDKSQKPVLFFERIYPATALYKTALLEFAKERADELGVALVSKEIGSETPYNGSLISYSSKAPFEYCDAAGGIQRESYALEDCYQIHPPQDT